MEVVLYNVRLRFQRLFADPVVFDDTSKLVQRYLTDAGVPYEKTIRIQQIAKDIVPIDDAGKPSAIAGTARYRHRGKIIRSEYMSPANLEISYVDFSSGLSRDEHRKFWDRGRWGDMLFEIKTFNHELLTLDLPEVDELYKLLRERAHPTTLVTVELANIPEALFHPTVGYMKTCLNRLAKSLNDAVEVYAAKDLDQQERQTLEKRLGRDSTSSTVFVILSKSRDPI